MNNCWNMVNKILKVVKVGKNKNIMKSQNN